MKTIRLTMAQALVRHLAALRVELDDGQVVPYVGGVWAIFGQTGPRVGSVDPGFGTAYLARIVGEKKAREIWYMCRRYTG